MPLKLFPDNLSYSPHILPHPGHLSILPRNNCGLCCSPLRGISLNPHHTQSIPWAGSGNTMRLCTHVFNNVKLADEVQNEYFEEAGMKGWYYTAKNLKETDIDSGN